MLKQIPHLHKNRIHVGRSNIHGHVLSMQFQLCYAIISLQLDVGPIIIWLVVGGVFGIEDKWGVVVKLEKICCPIINIAVMAVKKEDPLIELARSTGTTTKSHYLCPSTTVNISQHNFVE